MLLLETEKKESKNLKPIQKLLEQINQSPQYNQRRQSQNRRGNVYEETDQELQAYPEILIPYLSNSSKEAVFGNNRIEEEHATVKLQNE